ncbi:hypothetical protein ALC62_10709, partial [Cyphomyrmex costatus]
EQSPPIDILDIYVPTQAFSGTPTRDTYGRSSSFASVTATAGVLEVKPPLKPKQDHTPSGRGRRQNSIIEIATSLNRPGRRRAPSYWFRPHSLSGSTASALNAAHIRNLTMLELAKAISS